MESFERGINVIQVWKVGTYRITQKFLSLLGYFCSSSRYFIVLL